PDPGARRCARRCHGGGSEKCPTRHLIHRGPPASDVYKGTPSQRPMSRSGGSFDRSEPDSCVVTWWPSPGRRPPERHKTTPNALVCNKPRGQPEGSLVSITGEQASCEGVRSLTGNHDLGVGDLYPAPQAPTPRRTALLAGEQRDDVVPAAGGGVG